MQNIYVVVATYERGSNGLRVLYTLAKMLAQNPKFNVKIVCREEYSKDLEKKIPLRFKSMMLYENYNFDHRDIFPEDIVVYAEVVQGNPLGASRVVRYLLARPYTFLGEAIGYGDNDFLLSYSSTVDANLPQLFILNDEREIFHPESGTEKENQAAVYLGKMNKDVLVSRVKELRRLLSSFDKIVILDRLYPSSKLELVNILRRSKLFITLDPLTNLSYEATLCGTPSLVFDDCFNTTSGSFGVPLYGVINNIRNWEEAVQEVHMAYPTYIKALESQVERAHKAFEKIVEHFRRIEDPDEKSYLELNKVLHKAQDELDIARFKLTMKFAVSHAFFLSDIPEPVRKVLLAKASKQELEALKEVEEETRKNGRK